MTNHYERVRKARKALEDLRERFAREAAHPAITHCEECGCDWLDNGLNPVGCPYCKQSANAKILVAERDALEAEIEALRAEVSGLRAARIAYANEFPATEDGDPDTGNIHANIRALKARAERLAAEVAEWKRVAAAQAELHGEAEERAERLAAEVESLRRLVQERDTMLGKRLCAGTNADGKPRCLVLAEERARAERLAAALRMAEKLLKRTPKATRDMYVGSDSTGWGVQAASVLVAIRDALAHENRND